MSSFDEMWGPTWEVQKSIPGARCCVIENTDRAFRSSRPVVEAVFFDGNRKEICRRTGMRLTSKKGVDYVVCHREPERATTDTDDTSVGEL